MSRDSARVWTEEQVRALGLTTDIETAGSIYQLGRTKSYELARAGRFPTPVIRVGAKYVCPVVPILESLGIPQTDSDAGASIAPATAHNSPSPRSPHDDDDATHPPTASTLRRIHGV